MEEKSEEFLVHIGAGKENISEKSLKDLYLCALSLLPSQVESYTMGDSSSVPAETAEEILKSILFTVEKAINAQEMTINAFLSGDIQAIFRRGREIIDAETQKGRDLFEKVKATAPPIHNISYRDTLKGIESFFRHYESRFLAHAIPCNIDYQLCHNVSDDLLGIDYINEYLRVLFIENSFCTLFEPSAMKIVLRSHCPEYKELLVNLYEPIAVNALALALTGGKIQDLRIDEFDQKKLYDIFSRQPNADETLQKAAEQVCRELEILDAEQISYLEKTAKDLTGRIKAALKSGTLTGIFPTILPEKADNKTVFSDYQTMGDELLRAIIDEINDCRFVFDKCAIVLKKVRSLRDLAEILDICFWEGECLELFEEMGKPELSILLYFAQKREESELSETGWERKLIDFMKK